MCCWRLPPGNFNDWKLVTCVCFRMFDVWICWSLFDGVLKWFRLLWKKCTLFWMFVGLLQRCYKFLSLLLVRVKWLYVLSPLQNFTQGCSRCPKKCLKLFWMIPGCFCCFSSRLVVFSGFWLFGMSDEVREHYLPRPGECPSHLHNNIATLTTLRKEIKGNSSGSDCFGCASSLGCLRSL